MKIQAIKKLVEHHVLSEIILAEEMLLEGQIPEIQIEGEDKGEQLTHIFAAKYILEKIEGGMAFSEALREFTQKVRISINS